MQESGLSFPAFLVVCEKVCCRIVNFTIREGSMRILYYTWFENPKEDMISTLLYLGHSVISCNIPFVNYEDDIEFTINLEKIIENNNCDVIFSFDFFPLIAKTAERLRIKYISWVYDCPHRTLYSPAVKGAYNYIFVFDYVQFLKMGLLDIPHLFHFPLAVNTSRMEQLLGKMSEKKDFLTVHNNYQDDISFVGNLYEGNLYDQICYLPEYLKGYIDGVMQMQEQIYGYNFVTELLDDGIVEELKKYVLLELDASYFFTDRETYVDMINAKITSEERIHLLNQLARKYSVALYTASNAERLHGVKQKGTVSYQWEMPKVFRNSKINLNMTLRSIQSGIPLRALDIMGAGGFLLSNYQPELAESFIDGKELVLYGSEKELIEKADYYLFHEAEREAIAYQGFMKVKEKFSYEVRVKQMIDIVNM